MILNKKIIALVPARGGSKGIKMFYGDSMQEVQNFAHEQLAEIITEGNLGMTSKVESFKISAKKA